MKLQLTMIRVFVLVMVAAAIESRSVRPQDQNTQFVKKQQFLERSGTKILPVVQTRLVPLEIAIRHVPSFRRSENVPEEPILPPGVTPSLEDIKQYKLRPDSLDLSGQSKKSQEVLSFTLDEENSADLQFSGSSEQKQGA